MTVQTPITVEETKQLGLTVYHVRVNGVIMHTYFSAEMAETKRAQLERKLAKV